LVHSIQNIAPKINFKTAVHFSITSRAVETNMFSDANKNGGRDWIIPQRQMHQHGSCLWMQYWVYEWLDGVKTSLKREEKKYLSCDYH
jgi:hypothetical protein